MIEVENRRGSFVFTSFLLILVLYALAFGTLRFWQQASSSSACKKQVQKIPFCSHLNVSFKIVLTTEPRHRDEYRWE